MEGVQYFYANNLDLGATQYDITLRFARTAMPRGALKDGPAIPLRVEELEVSMSPQHAKAMIAPLLQVLLDHEKTIGSLSLSDEQKEKLHRQLKLALEAWV